MPQENVDALDAFSLPDEMVQVRKDEDGHEEAQKSTKEQRGERAKLKFESTGYRRGSKTLSACRSSRVASSARWKTAASIATSSHYRGLARDLDLIREHLRRGRPRIHGVAGHAGSF